MAQERAMAEHLLLLDTGDALAGGGLGNLTEGEAIVAGMKVWGLPIEPLGGFEVDAHIPTIERED